MEEVGKRKRTARVNADYADGAALDDEVKRQRKAPAAAAAPPKPKPIVKLTVTQPMAELSREEQSLLRRYAALRAAHEANRARPAEETNQQAADGEASKAELLEALKSAQRDQDEQEQRQTHRARPRR